MITPKINFPTIFLSPPFDSRHGLVHQAQETQAPLQALSRFRFCLAAAVAIPAALAVRLTPAGLASVPAFGCFIIVAFGVLAGLGGAAAAAGLFVFEASGAFSTLAGRELRTLLAGCAAGSGGALMPASDRSSWTNCW